MGWLHQPHRSDISCLTSETLDDGIGRRPRARMRGTGLSTAQAGIGSGRISMLTLACLAVSLVGAPVADTLTPRPIHQLVHTTWTPKAGGGPIGIRDLAQTADGYIWIASYFGLWRFDGVRFVRYTPLGGDSIPDGAVDRLLATRDGALWMLAGRGGVTRLRSGRVATFSRTEGLPSARDLAESSRGMLVAGGVDGLYRYSHEQWEAVGPAWGLPGKQARAVWFDRDDALWVVTEDRVVYLPEGGKRFLDPGIPMQPAPEYCRFAQEQDGTVWFAGVGMSVYTLRKAGDQAAEFSQVKIDPLGMIIDRRGSLWIASSVDGLRRVPEVARIHGRQIETYGAGAERFTMKDGLLADIPTALLQDREGNIWVGSANGLERFREGAFSPFLGQGPARPRFVMAGRDSAVWSGPYNFGSLQRFGPHGVETLHPGFNNVTIAQDSAGTTWLVDGQDRLLRLEGRRFVPVRLRPGTTRGVYSLTTDPGGTVWVYSTQFGLLRLAGDSLVQVAALEEPTLHTGQPYSDSQGRIWVGQANRVALYAGGRLTLFRAAEGIGGFVYGFFEDRSGTIWVSTGDGLSQFDGSRFRTLKRKGAIPGYTVYGAAQDDDGAWWLATLPGILRFPPGEIERALADSTYTPHYRSFDESDGMIGALVKGYWGPILARSGDGMIWVATDSGLARIDPRALPLDRPPPVSLEVVRIQGREVALSEAGEIPSGTSDLEIDYTSLTFAIPERIQYRYQLEGVDPAWREVGSRRRAYYSGLAPGTYRFRVTASYGDGRWDAPGAAWSFRVLPAWYQTLWFRGVVVLLIVGAGAGIAVLAQRGRHARAQQALRGRYEATLAERSRIAQDLHDTLLQGFAGVSMQLKAAERALPEEPDVATETLIHVQRLTRETLREARERIMDLQEPELGHEDVAAALEAGGLALVAGTGIGFSLITRGERRRLPRGVEVAALRIGREAIANAVRHAAAARIDVVVDFEAAGLHLEVRDDGCGFSVAEGERARHQGHFGLSGMQARAARAGGSCTVGAGPAGGTVVAVSLPVGRGASAGAPRSVPG